MFSEGCLRREQFRVIGEDLQPALNGSFGLLRSLNESGWKAEVNRRGILTARVAAPGSDKLATCWLSVVNLRTSVESWKMCRVAPWNVRS